MVFELLVDYLLTKMIVRHIIPVVDNDHPDVKWYTETVALTQKYTDYYNQSSKQIMGEFITMLNK